jgi:hypothetical protein
MKNIDDFMDFMGVLSAIIFAIGALAFCVFLVLI